MKKMLLILALFLGVSVATTQKVMAQGNGHPPGEICAHVENSGVEILSSHMNIWGEMTVTYSGKIDQTRVLWCQLLGTPNFIIAECNYEVNPDDEGGTLYITAYYGSFGNWIYSSKYVSDGWNPETALLRLTFMPQGYLPYM